MTDKLTIGVFRDDRTGRLQVSINQLAEDGTGTGYRLAGPKFNGTGETLLERPLDERDAAEIRRYLDAVFPAPAPAGTSQRRARPMTASIRWEETPVGVINGYVGTLDPHVFGIWKPPQASGEWVLTAELPGAEAVRFYGDDPEELKPEAERLLSRFVTSLGASFPESGHAAAHTLTVNLSGTDEAVTDSVALMSALEDYADRKWTEAADDDSQSKFARSAERLRAAVEAAAEGRAGQ